MSSQELCPTLSLLQFLSKGVNGLQLTQARLCVSGLTCLFLVRCTESPLAVRVACNDTDHKDMVAPTARALQCLGGDCVTPHLTVITTEQNRAGDRSFNSTRGHTKTVSDCREATCSDWNLGSF